jgi:hypothetical protein
MAGVSLWFWDFASQETAKLRRCPPFAEVNADDPVCPVVDVDDVAHMIGIVIGFGLNPLAEVAAGFPCPPATGKVDS